MSTSNVIVYRYEGSPYSKKIDNILLFKGIKHSIVNVASAPPRPELSQLLGVTYRQIPVLSIGNDIYCDTSLISSALERRFPDSKTIYSPRKDGSTSDAEIIKLFSKYYIDSIFLLGVGLLPWDKFPKTIVEDRAKFFGLNAEALVANKSHTRGQFVSQLSLLEEQLSDGRHWLFDTEEPTLADISVHFVAAWVKSWGESAHLNKEKLPYLSKWFSQMDDYLDSLKAEYGTSDELQGETASQAVASSKWEDYDVVGFDAGDLEVKIGDTISVSSTSVQESNPTVGKLVSMNAEEVVIKVNGQSGTAHCHFPRVGFSIKSAV